MTSVRRLKMFKYQVTKIAKDKGANLFDCYCYRDIFRIETAKTVRD